MSSKHDRGDGPKPDERASIPAARQTASTRDFFASTRLELRQAMESARSRMRAGSTAAGPLAESATQARATLASVSAQAHTRLNKVTAPCANAARELNVADLHALDQVLSHLRHSVVRICFYNLKLFSPSLIDEYDAQVRDHVEANMNKLDAVEREVRAFFDEVLSEGLPVGRLFPGGRMQVERALAELKQAVALVTGHLEEPAPREAFARSAPTLIDRVMGGLEQIQTDLESRKVVLAEVAEEAMTLHVHACKDAGLALDLESVPAPKVFVERDALLNAFGEVIANTARHAGATQLRIHIGPAAGNSEVLVAFIDNGDGMPPDIVADCTRRGLSTNGTGEGLAMVREIVEVRHLGKLHITSTREAGTTVEMRFPVKVSPEAPRL